MRFLTAHKLFSGTGFLPDSSVLVLDGQNKLKDIVTETQVENNEIERFEGIITPGFVNAHCHLELSHLKNKIPTGTGLPSFAMQVVAQRTQFGKEEIVEHCLQADRDMWNSGIVAVGDISNTEDSLNTKTTSKIFYHSFIELIGLKPESSSSIFAKGQELLQKFRERNCSASLAPHAPYSTSLELIQKIAEYDGQEKMPLSIHNQESDEETKFFYGQASGFHELYRSFNLDISWFVPPNTSSLKYYSQALSKGGSILVHNTCSTHEDVLLGLERDVSWCFCPGANTYIENRVPDFNLFKQQVNKICIGTDSLASNSQLDVLHEINLILSTGNAFTAEQLLQAATYNGALALGIADKFGSFVKGKNPGLNLVELKNSRIKFIEKIV